MSTLWVIGGGVYGFGALLTTAGYIFQTVRLRKPKYRIVAFYIRCMQHLRRRRVGARTHVSTGKCRSIAAAGGGAEKT